MNHSIFEDIKNRIKPYLYFSKIFLSKYSSRQRRSLEKYKNFYSNNFINPGDLVFDVGANYGDKTEIFLSVNAKVVSIEPQEQCINIMKKRFRNNDQVVLIEKGLSNNEGILEFYICDNTNTISTFSEKWKKGRFSSFRWDRTKKIPVTALDNLIKIYDVPAYCKIDVEGYEVEVLKGLSCPIKYISFEFTKEFFDDARLCMDHIMTLGNPRFNWACGCELKLQKWVKADELCEILEGIKDDSLHGDIYSKLI